MKILSTFDKGKLRLYFVGELDHHAAKGAMQTLTEKIDVYLPRDCIVDLSDLKFMDSSGIAVILKTHKRMNEIGGRAWVENARAQPLKVIAASGIERLIRVTTDTKE